MDATEGPRIKNLSLSELLESLDQHLALLQERIKADVGAGRLPIARQQQALLEEIRDLMRRAVSMKAQLKRRERA